MPEQALLPSLCELLIDAVHGGASVGFLAPLAMRQGDALMGAGACFARRRAFALGG